MFNSKSPPLYMREPGDESDDVALHHEAQSCRSPENKTGRRTSLDLDSIQLGPPEMDYAEWVSNGKGLSSSARVTTDGRISVSLDLKQSLPDLRENYATDVKEFGVDETGWKRFPCMNIVIMVVGSRGDVQPYVALGKLLQRDGHRVRIATHEVFRSFVNDAGLEFFDIGGNPQDLMSYMVKNPGLIPGIESLTNGDIGRKREMLSEMINGCWLSCNSPCPVTGRTFSADAIISNPPAFAHVHCAEALGIPLLLSFTMPWCECFYDFMQSEAYAADRSPTTAFPHPLVNINQSNAEHGLTNYLTYAVADLLTWQGIGDIINTFRTQALGLHPLSLRSGPGLADRVKVPWTYCMSPSLVPKPKDWRGHIDIVGFYFLDLATDYKPPDDLAAFLAGGEPPIFIGFGSVVVKDPANMTKIIFEATAKAGVRALVSAGWGGIGDVSVPSHIFMLGNVPHDWLFDNGRVSAVIHHGGAGTTAAGLAKGRPTAIVPFFGDQGFWGSMVYKAGAGPEPIPHKELNVTNLMAAIKFINNPSAKIAANRLSDQIRTEEGVVKGLESFYRHLPLLNMRCDLDPSRLAVWWSTEHCIKLSTFAAQILANAQEIDSNNLDFHRTKEYDTRKKVSDPVTGGANAIFWTVTNYYAGIAQIFFSPVKGIMKTTTAIPRGVLDVVTSIQEGLHNIPAQYGSETRQLVEVTDFKSGIKEAGKGLFYGYYDGITGLVREPIQGAKKGGLSGAVKGSARSFVNATMRPAIGIVDLVAYPLQGMRKSVQTPTSKRQEEQQRKTRLADGIEAVRNSTEWERLEIIHKFREAKTGTKERQKKYKEGAEKVIREAQDTNDNERTEMAPASTTVVANPSDPPDPILSSQTQNESDYDAVFESDLRRAKKLSLADQNLYLSD